MATQTRAARDTTWTASGSVLLVSCYELGRQPFSLASAWAQLEQAGFGVAAVDTAVDALDVSLLERARLVALSVPMHTALRLGVEVARRIRERAPGVHICFYGLYAALNAERLLAQEADSVIGGEFEEALVELARVLARGEPACRAPGVVTAADGLVTRGKSRTAPSVLRRLPFTVPRRDGLAPLERYATFQGPRPGDVRRVGYVEASRGCKHTCRHCPITPVYQGRFFAVPSAIVLADAAQQIAAGAGHITFGDPDFFNGPTHSMRIARALHAAHPDVTFDVTIKIEHLIAEPELVAELAGLGCAFIVSAVESLSDTVLQHLDKRHSRADVFAALTLCRQAGIALRPSLVPFTPWATLADYRELCDWVCDEGLVDHLEPIQLAIRLLLPPGSALLWHDEPRPWLGDLAADDFGFRWRHPDPRMDQLFDEVSAAVDAGRDADPGEVVLCLRALAYQAAGQAPPERPLPPRHFVPRLSEAWFCCAEPHSGQRAAADAVTGCS
jgi:radical SAM superfamily enzyme YgiQ (UPF0313 family)